MSCPYCGDPHPKEQCPRVKSIEYHGDGTVKTVVFHDAVSQPQPVAIGRIEKK